MRVVMFYHSILSDWNHGNAHFVRGVASDLLRRGYEVLLYEPWDSWSRSNLLRHHGPESLQGFRRAYPDLWPTLYDRCTLDLDGAIREGDVVLVHEWNEPEFVAALGRHREARGDYRLLFHDTHHRSVSEPQSMERYDLHHYDGVLAFGSVIRDLYMKRGWAKRAWTWHEAADVRVFRPTDGLREGECVWIGNWGDEERSEELQEFLVEPIRRLKLRCTIHGVRYPAPAVSLLEGAGIRYAGWLANYNAPRVFARHAFTVHVPRRYYAQSLPGIPTIRPFEALACGIPLISAPWNDADRLFTPGCDYLVARDGQEMEQHMRDLCENDELRKALADHGRRTVLSRHTCAHRVEELLEICEDLGLDGSVGRGRGAGAERMTA